MSCFDGTIILRRAGTSICSSWWQITLRLYLDQNLWKNFHANKEIRYCYKFKCIYYKVFFDLIIKIKKYRKSDTFWEFVTRKITFCLRNLTTQARHQQMCSTCQICDRMHKNIHLNEYFNLYFYISFHPCL